MVSRQSGNLIHWLQYQMSIVFQFMLMHQTCAMIWFSSLVQLRLVLLVLQLDNFQWKSVSPECMWKHSLITKPYIYSGYSVQLCIPKPGTNWMWSVLLWRFRNWNHQLIQLSRQPPLGIARSNNMFQVTVSLTPYVSWACALIWKITLISGEKRITVGYVSQPMLLQTLDCLQLALLDRSR